MKPDKNQEKIYVPLIREFKNQTADLYKKVWINKTADFSGLFIPHVFDDYYSAKTKVFFIGQDTYGWPELEKTYDLSEKEYLVENNKWPESIDSTLEWTNPYTFWNFVNRLQLALSGAEIDNVARKATMKEVLTGKKSSVKEIEGFCQREKLESNRCGKIGFNS